MSFEAKRGMHVMFTTIDFSTKAALRTAVANGVPVGVFTNHPWRKNPLNGTVSLAGPYPPAKTRWHALAELEAGLVVRVK